MNDSLTSALIISIPSHPFGDVSPSVVLYEILSALLYVVHILKCSAESEFNISAQAFSVLTKAFSCFLRACYSLDIVVRDAAFGLL